MIQTCEHLCDAEFELQSDECLRIAAELRSHVLRTPVRRLRWLESMIGKRVYAKLENHQLTGSFKVRGALACLRGIPTDRPVVTASAGNHALAMAHAARVCGHELLVCIPTTASRTKRNRLLEDGVALLEFGHDLASASAFARQFAQRYGYEFVSAYDDMRVVLGQASVALEFLEQTDLRTLVLPVGGGGLLAGASLAVQRQDPSISLVACQAAEFPSYAQCLEERAPGHTTYRPSLADGLIVDLEPGCFTLRVGKRFLKQVLLVEETSLALASSMLLEYESLLVEPSGAAPVAAILQHAESFQHLSGPVGVVLSGGNVTVERLLHLLTYPLPDDRSRQLLDIQGRPADQERIPVRPSVVARMPAKLNINDDARSHALVQTNLVGLDARVGELKKQWSDFGSMWSLALPAFGARVTQVAAALVHHLKDLVGVLRSGAASPADSEQCLRLALDLASCAGNLVSWQAPAHLQTQTVATSRPEEIRNPSANYARYGCRAVTEREWRLQEVLGFNPARASLMATSSGMAAYTLVESYLLRHVLRPGDAVVASRGLYFEVAEQLESLPFVSTVIPRGDGVDPLLAAVKRHQPRVVIIDPLANAPDMRLLSVCDILRRLKENIDHPCVLVIDGTMLSGAFDPFATSTDISCPSVIYFESASKYLQLGLDLTLAGIVAFSPHLRPLFERLQRNTGTILYSRDEARLPEFDRAAYLDRLSIMTRNLLRICDAFQSADELAGACEVCHPLLKQHPDHEVASEYHHLGGLMVLRFTDPGLNQRHVLNAAIEHMLSVASDMRVPLTKGVSFGYSFPRISAAAAMAERCPPFLRLSVGAGSLDEVSRLAECLVRAIKGFLKSVKR